MKYCMSKVIVDATREENYLVAIIDNKEKLEYFSFENNQKKTIKSNIYLGKITRVEHSLQAAFVDYGGEKAGFLPFSEIHPNYYHLPIKDKREITALLKKEQIDNEIEENKDNDEIETDNENSKELSRNLYNIYKKYNIQEVIKRGQPVLVQVYKDERGNKGVSLTTYISIPGRYCVLMPNSPRGIGVSKKVFSYEERKRVLSSIKKEFDIKLGSGLIIRTAGMKVPISDLKKDYEYLKNIWEEIGKKTLTSKINGIPIYKEINIVEQVIRDNYESNEQSEIIISGEKCFNEVKEFVEKIMPDELEKLKKYTNKTMAIFKKYKIDKKLDELLSPIAQLPSGGYLVINPTEALVSIDVNSGKSINYKNVEETAINTNIEAAREIARQLRLRNLGGLIVVDFIDMFKRENQHLLEHELQKVFMLDKAKIQFTKISQFGLVEISRQRMRSSIAEMLTIKCPHCYGTGFIKAHSIVSVDILDSIKEKVVNCSDKQEFLEVLACDEVIDDLVVNHIKEIEEIKKEFNIKILTTKRNFNKNEEYILQYTNDISDNNRKMATEIYHSIAKNYNAVKSNCKKEEEKKTTTSFRKKIKSFFKK